MVSVCLSSDALLQHLPSYLGFSYLGHGVSLHNCSSKAQPLLLTLDDGYLLTAAVPDLQRGIAPLGPPVPAATARQVAPPGLRAGSLAAGGCRQTPGVRDQGRPEATSCPRPGTVTLRSHPEPEARAGGRRSNPKSGGCTGTGGPRGAIPL